jgi:phenylacetate-coenzyme A ligase PaaK-like adenylate-forming protein
MKFDFSSFPVRNKGFSEQPMTILDAEPKAMLCSIMEIALIETGNPAARERWQKIQLRNLLQHAGQRSAFWRQRIGGKKPADIELAALPIQTRRDARNQVAAEGALLRAADGIPVKSHATSGSSGTPVSFFISAMNSQYAPVRSTAQYFMEGWDLSLNRVRLHQSSEPLKNGFSVEESPSWMGPMAPLFKSGTNKNIEYLDPDPKQLVRELEKSDIGHLVCRPLLLEWLFDSAGPAFLKRANVKIWLPYAENVSDHLVKIFAELEIPIRSNYSSEEFGPVGFECQAAPGHYHVATSNVIVEVVDVSHELDGTKLGKVLVTHLHSYATPFIRYDLGDLACLREECPCGHSGPTLHNLRGRLSSVLKHRDGKISSFHIRGKQLAAFAAFTEYRMRQTEFEKIVIEIGGRSELSADEIGALTAFLKERAGPRFEIEILAREKIDWGESRKRHGFRSEVA